MSDYQTYMEEGHSAAWERDWKSAIEAYSKAVQSATEDADAHINLGMALLRDTQLDRAMKVFKRAQQLAPEDPVPLEGQAETYQEMGQLEDASKQLLKVSEFYLAQRDLMKAISVWEHATTLTPGLVSVHARLAQAYERVDRKDDAIRAYLILAYNFQLMGDVPKAKRAVDRALKIDGNHSIGLSALRALQSGGEIALPDEYINRDVKPLYDEAELDFDDGRDIGEAHPDGPIGEAMEESLGLLAESVIVSGLDETVMMAMQGMELQRQDQLDAAVEAYLQADRSGMNVPSLKMNIGGLLLLKEQYEEAIKYLEPASHDPMLAAGALHGLGIAYNQRDKQHEATAYLIQSLRAVDTSLAATPHEEQELISVYRSLLAALEGRDTESLRLINERLVGLLTGANWKQRITQTRIHLDEILKDEGGQGMVDYLKDGGDELTDLVATVDRYMQMGLFTLAMDEAHYATQVSPWYLPVHVRMAEIMMKEGRMRQAIDKYNTVARLYLTREENDRAAVILQEVLEMAPLNIDVRFNLIQLLEDEDRWDEALENYVSLAETYQQLGDFERASETFEASEELAERIDSDPAITVRIKHFIADIHQIRLNTRAAQEVYENILQIDPNDEKALRALIDLFYNQGNQVEAIKRLDVLLGFYARNGEIDKIVKMLESLIRLNPDDAAVRQRLASIYRRRGQNKEAIEQLDALGELQLEAGLMAEAANTIKQIISMKPDRVDEYKRLLGQLGG